MPKKNFLSWYYSQGLKDFLEISKNLTFYLWEHFSISELFLTLLSPWKRDISRHYWRGFQPLRSLQSFFETSISRIIGSLVRLTVLIFGLFLITSYVLANLAVLLVWLFPPVVIAGMLIFPVAPAYYFSLVIFFLLLFVFLIYIVYSYSNRVSYRDLSMAEIARHKWFSRVWNRLGGEQDQFQPEIFSNQESLDKFLRSLNISLADFNAILEWEIKFQEEKENRRKFWLKENLEKIAPIGRQWKYAYTVNLDLYSMDLTRFDPTDYRKKELIGRQEELNLINLILSRTDQNSVLLVGDSGIGKTTLIHHLAGLIRINQCDDFLKNTRILVLDLGGAISQAASEGKDVENELNILFQEAALAGNVILVLQNVENFLGANGGLFRPDVSVIMNEFLQLPNFQILATSTNKEYHQLIEKHENFMKYFEVVEMKEPTEEEAVEILLNNFKEYENQRVLFTLGALKRIVSSSEKYRWEVPLPERALDLANETFTFWRANAGTTFILTETVDDFVTLKTGSPQGEVKEEERGKLLNLEDILHNRVIGQEEAVRQVAEALRRARSGISDPKRPVGSFLFLGPTGVGKTETAKALAEGYFGDEEKMIRLDMSEFQSPLSLDRLVGSSQLNQPGQLVSLVKDDPFSLLLLDELEKANPQILDLFLQVLDEGFLTDAFGEKINFRSMIIIATSNAGSALIKNMVEENRSFDEIKSGLINYIVENNIFRVEFINRFDGIIFFRPLNQQELVSVVQLMLNKFRRRLAEEKNLMVSFDEGFILKIIERGYDPIFGARSLNRFIEDKVENLIATKIISGEAKRGEEIMLNENDLN